MRDLTRRILALWLGLALVPLAGARAGEGPQGAYWDKIRTKKKLNIAIQENYPPYSMKNKEGQYIGYDVELSRKICKVLGVKPVFHPMPFKEAIPGLESGKVDLAVVAMTITGRRALRVNFSHPYMMVSQGALLDKRFLPGAGVERDVDDVSAQFSSYFDLGRLQDLSIAVKKGSAPEAHARRNFPRARLVLVKDATAAVEALMKGEVKAMVHDAPFIKVWLATHGSKRFRLHTLLKPATKDGLGVAIRKGDLEFLRWLDTYLQVLDRSGVLAKMQRYYFEELGWRDEVNEPE